MKETRLQVEKADLEQKLVIERLEKEQHNKNYLDQIEHTKTLEENLKQENEKRIELEKQLAQLKQDLESKVDKTAEDAEGSPTRTRERIERIKFQS